jgi:hypothetical protein
MKPKTLLITIIIFSLLFACKSIKDISKVNDSTAIEVPFTGKEYQSDKDYFRAKQSGKSPDLSTAKKIALQNAKSELAGSINILIKVVTDQYTNQRTISDKQEFANKFEEDARSVVVQEINDVKIIGEKVFKEPDNAYTYWIAIETPKENIQNKLDKTISSDEKLQLDFDKQQFMKIFNEEMEKFDKTQQIQ